MPTWYQANITNRLLLSFGWLGCTSLDKAKLWWVFMCLKLSEVLRF